MDSYQEAEEKIFTLFITNENRAWDFTEVITYCDVEEELAEKILMNFIKNGLISLTKQKLRDGI